jgi:hypothetical protein
LGRGYHRDIRIHRLTREQIQGLRETREANWLKVLIDDAIEEGHLEWIHAITQHFTQEQIQRLSFIQLELLTNTNPQFPMNLLSEGQRFEIESWKGQSWPAWHGADENPLELLRVDHTRHLREHRNDILRLRDAIRQLSNEDVATLAANRPGFPIGFLSKTQVRALPEVQLRALVDRLPRVLELERELVVQMNHEGRFAFRDDLPTHERRDLFAKAAYQRLFLFSRGLLPFSRLTQEQIQLLSGEQQDQIRQLRTRLQLGRLLNQDFNHRLEHRIDRRWQTPGIDELFRRFYNVSLIP